MTNIICIYWIYKSLPLAKAIPGMISLMNNLI